MLGILGKVFKDADEFEKQVFKLAFKRMGGTPADARCCIARVASVLSGFKNLWLVLTKCALIHVRLATRPFGDVRF